MTEQAKHTGRWTWGGSDRQRGLRHSRASRITRATSRIGQRLFVLTLTLLLFASLGLAKGTNTFNFKVIDGNAWLIEMFRSVKIYALDAETGDRVDALPVIVEHNPDEPIRFQLEPGHYEFVVELSYLSEDVIYFQFEMIEGAALQLVDLRELELPEELSVY